MMGVYCLANPTRTNREKNDALYTARDGTIPKRESTFSKRPIAVHEGFILGRIPYPKPGSSTVFWGMPSAFVTFIKETATYDSQ